MFTQFRHEQDERRQDQEAHEREERADGAENDERAAELGERDEQILGAVVRELRDIEQVARQPRHELARLVPVEVGTGQALKFTKEVAPHIRLDLGAGHVPLVRHVIVEEHFENVKPQQNPGENQKNPYLAVRQIDVQDLARENRENEVAPRDPERRNEIEQKLGDIRFIVVRETTDHERPPCR